MEALKTILRFLDTQANTPKYLGVFHIVWIALAIAASIALCILWKKGVIKNVNKVALIASLVVLALGLYKQVVLSFGYNPTLTFNYDFNNFPWHFATVPFIVGIFMGATSGRINKHFQSYLATFGLLAGLWEMFQPHAFVSTVGLNIYSMICSVTMIALAVLVLYSQEIKLEIKTYFNSLPVFAMMVGIAISFNELANLISTTQNISMFSIDRHSPSTAPVYSYVHNAFLATGNGISLVEYILCIIFYFTFMSLCSLAIFGLIIGMKKLLTTDFDLEYGVAPDTLAQKIRHDVGLEDDGEEIFKFGGKVNTSKNTYRQTYFKNLHTNFNENHRESCGYVALSMLLSYYDTILCDNIVPKTFDEPVRSEKEPNFEESPGVECFYQPEFNPDEMSYKKYVRHINRNKNKYLYERLLKIAIKKKLNDKPKDKKSTDYNFRATAEEIREVAENYLRKIAKLKGSDYSIDVKQTDEKTTSEDIRDYIIRKIKQGYPVWVGVSDPNEKVGHIVIAYDYNEKLDKIYCHFGYRDETRTYPVVVQKRNKLVIEEEEVTLAYTKLVPEEVDYTLYTSALVIDFNEEKISHSHTNNYEVAVRGDIFYYCPDGTYTTKNDLVIEFNKNKHKLSVVGANRPLDRRLEIPKRYGKVKVAKLENGAFKNQKYLRVVDLDCKIDYISRKAFRNCKRLHTVSIPHSVKRLKAKSFAGCKSLTTIHYQGTVNQWYHIRKSDSWDRNTGRYKVYCLDGILYKFGAEHVKIF